MRLKPNCVCLDVNSFKALLFCYHCLPTLLMCSCSPHSLTRSPSSPQVPVATAQVLFHRFYMHKSLKRFNVKNIATASLYLACKLEECVRSWKDFVNVIHALHAHRSGTAFVPPLESDPGYWDMRNDLVVAERHILKELGFLLRVEHPHKFILSYINVLGGDNRLAQSAWSLVNDAMRSAICIQQRPEAVAVTALYIAARLNQLPLPETPEPWWRLFNVTYDEIDFIGCQILHVQQITGAYVELNAAQ